jgi:hypothetical protein
VKILQKSGCLIFLFFFFSLPNMTSKKHSASSHKHKSLFHKYHILHRPDKALPILKTDKDLEVEGLARLSLDLASFNITDEQDRLMPESPQEIQEIQKEKPPAITKQRPRYPNILNARHSIGFDVPGAVHTILTPSKPRYFS